MSILMFVILERRPFVDMTANFAAVIRPVLFRRVLVTPVYTTGGTLGTQPKMPACFE